MYFFNYPSNLTQTDAEVALLILQEYKRQQYTIELIASENFTSKAVMAALGSPLTNKYAEGYPGHRYYGGCEYIDQIQSLAIDRACSLFNCTYANVQPHSGAQANMASFFALLNPGDSFLGMDLSAGGHLTHGSKVNFSGKIYQNYSYGVTQEGYIDYEQCRKIAIEKKPRMIIAGASAYPRIIDFKQFREIADEVGAYLMVDMAHIAGLVATGYHPSPIPFADIVTTTTHKTLRGPRGGMILSSEQFAQKHGLNKAIFPGIQGGPLENVVAAKAVALKQASGEDFKKYSKQIIKNSKRLAEALIQRGINLVSNGTDNHLMLLDLRNTDFTGVELEKALEQIHITANKNAIPNDPKGPNITSGLRLGTPAVTTKGYKQQDMQQIAQAIRLIVKKKDYKTANYITDKLIDKYATV